MLRIYNSLSRKVEEFLPIHPPKVGMYSCGPTVYDFAHVGNFRTYVMADLLYRALGQNRYDVTYIMNITDVGHLTGDNVGDADTGEDRMEKSAKKAGKSAWDIAKYYTDAFLKDFERLNLKKPKQFTKATDHIEEQVVLVKRLEEKGFTYTTSDGVYFDTSKFPDYGKLSHLDEIKEGARVEVNPEKRNPRDFALWKFSPKNEKRQMEWDSPWGVGFPGWHIECSAMSMKYLGESFDIHTGGIDLSETHHPNEIAQAEAATGKPFVKYWVHGAFILVDGKRMSKSLGNNYKLQDVVQKGYDPLALRYLYLQTHYRQEMNFSWAALDGAQKALEKLWQEAKVFGEESRHLPSEEALVVFGEFEQAIQNDLNMPKALAALYAGLARKKTEADARYLLEKVEPILGLDLIEKGKTVFLKEKTAGTDIPEGVLALARERDALRREKKFHIADQMRNKIINLGYLVSDEKGETVVKKI